MCMWSGPSSPSVSSARAGCTQNVCFPGRKRDIRPSGQGTGGAPPWKVASHPTSIIPPKNCSGCPTMESSGKDDHLRVNGQK